jgi:hypothetical protein
MKLFSNKPLLFLTLWVCPTLMMIGANYIAINIWNWSTGIYENIFFPTVLCLIFAFFEYKRIVKAMENNNTNRNSE